MDQCRNLTKRPPSTNKPTEKNPIQKVLHVGENLFGSANHIGCPEIVLENVKRANQKSECCLPEELTESL